VTGDSCARYGEIRNNFPVWRQALEVVLASELSSGAASRVGLVGFSLGARWLSTLQPDLEAFERS
jgi:hypothetical protein